MLAVGDAAFQKKCLGKMGDVAREGRTVLFVSHNMVAIQHLCMVCLLLEGGQLMLTGSPQTTVQVYLTKDQDTMCSVAERKDRQGNGAIRFTDIKVLYTDDIPIDSAICGQDVFLAVSYRSDGLERARRLDVHITFYTLADQFLINADYPEFLCGRHTPASGDGAVAL